MVFGLGHGGWGLDTIIDARLTAAFDIFCGRVISYEAGV